MVSINCLWSKSGALSAPAATRLSPLSCEVMLHLASLSMNQRLLGIKLSYQSQCRLVIDADTSRTTIIASTADKIIHRILCIQCIDRKTRASCLYKRRLRRGRAIRASEMRCKACGHVLSGCHQHTLGANEIYPLHHSALEKHHVIGLVKYEALAHVSCDPAAVDDKTSVANRHRVAEVAIDYIRIAPAKILVTKNRINYPHVRPA